MPLTISSRLAARKIQSPLDSGDRGEEGLL